MPFLAVATFDKPVPIVSDTKAYYISIQASNEDDPNSVTDFGLINFNPDTPAGRQAWQTTDDVDRDNQNTWTPSDDGANLTPIYQLQAVFFDDNPEGDFTPEDGLGCSFVDLIWQDFGGTLRMDNFNRLDFLLEIDGLQSAGGQLIQSPVTLCDVLMHEYRSNEWVRGNFNISRYNSTYNQYTDVNEPFFRNINGRTYNRTTNRELINEIARNSFSKFVYEGFDTDASYSVLAVGKERQPTALITDNDALIRRWFTNNLNTVVNTIDINYCLLYTSPSPRDQRGSRMPSSA